MDSPTNSKKKKALNKKELWAEFLLFCDRSGFTLISVDPDGTYPCFTDVVLSFNGSRFNLSVNLRNISSAYLPKDPTVKRRQVQSLDRELLPKNTKDHLSLCLDFMKTTGKRFWVLGIHSDSADTKQCVPAIFGRRPSIRLFWLVMQRQNTALLQFMLAQIPISTGF